MNLQDYQRCDRARHSAAFGSVLASRLGRWCTVCLAAVALQGVPELPALAQYTSPSVRQGPNEIQQPGFVLPNSASPSAGHGTPVMTGSNPNRAPQQPPSGFSSLWRQLLPQATPTTEQTPAIQAAPITAESSSAPVLAKRDEQQSETPRTNGLWQQLFTSTNDAATAPSSQPQTPPIGALPPQSVAVPIGTASRRGEELISALAPRQDGQSLEPAMQHVAAASAQTASDSSHPLESSLFLQPFYMTNENKWQMSGRDTPHLAAHAAPSSSLRGVESALRQSALVDQLTMMTNGARTTSGTAGEWPIWSEQAAWEQGWAAAMPSLINPFTLAQQPAHALRAPIEGAKLAAYFQEESLPPMPPAENDTNGSPDADAAADEQKSLAEAESVGEEPEDTSLQFLRTVTVLLKPGESQFDIGINYLFAENTFPVLLSAGGGIVGVEDARFRIRELTVPLQYRYGLLDNVQAFVGAPLGWANTQVSTSTFEAFDNDGGIGDLDFGATIQLVEGNAEKHHVIATISATAPTGGDPFGARAALAPLAPSLGQGFWSISADVLCIQTYDPLVFFYGVGMEHFIARHFGSQEIEPGSMWNYTFGVGFAVNERVTLSTRFLGAYVEEVRLNRERLLGSNIEPMSLRLAATISKPCKRLVEPFVEFGITDAAPEAFLGITWTY